MTRKLLALAVAVVVSAAAAAAAVAAGTEAGTRTHPYPAHSLVTLPEAKGWKLRVNSATPNATAQVRDANQFNKAPASGRQFFIVNVTMAYAGKGASTAFQSGQLNAIGRANRSYTFKDTCGVVPNALDEYKKISAGKSVTGNVCFSVRKGDVASLQLSFEPLFSMTNRQVFFALR